MSELGCMLDPKMFVSPLLKIEIPIWVFQAYLHKDVISAGGRTFCNVARDARILSICTKGCEMNFNKKNSNELNIRV